MSKLFETEKGGCHAFDPPECMHVFTATVALQQIVNWHSRFGLVLQ